MSEITKRRTRRKGSTQHTAEEKVGKPTSLGKRKTVRQRAQAIIHNKRRYDEDTRQAIANALHHDAADLKECVRRAERGETILDLTAEQTKHEKTAQYIIDMFDVEDIPDFITDAVMDALLKAERIKGIKVWSHAAEGFSRRALADLLAVSRMLSISPAPGSRAALADHISAVVKHPEAPATLINAIADELTEMSASDWGTPEMIQRALEDHARALKGREVAN